MFFTILVVVVLTILATSLVYESQLVHPLDKKLEDAHRTIRQLERELNK